jgi:hypothetical protein
LNGKIGGHAKSGVIVKACDRYGDPILMLAMLRTELQNTLENVVEILT